MSYGAANLNLEHIRRLLERMEDPIIYSLIERLQYGQSDMDEEYLKKLFHDLESIYVTRGRYFPHAPEYPFTDPKRLPKSAEPIDKAAAESWLTYYDSANVNEQLLEDYFEKAVPIFVGGSQDLFDDTSRQLQAASCDIKCLQLISTRVHAGRLVAEVKYRQGGYNDLVETGDFDGIMKKLTNPLVEDVVLKRIRHKVATFTVYQQFINKELLADQIAYLFEQMIIPWTKYVEVDYLLAKKKSKLSTAQPSKEQPETSQQVSAANSTVHQPDIISSMPVKAPSVEQVLPSINFERLIGLDADEVLKLARASIDVGFFTLCNHGIDIGSYFEISKKFFLDTSLTEKQKYAAVDGAHGYISANNEKLDGYNADPKEAFNFRFPLDTQPDLPESLKLHTEQIIILKQSLYNVGKGVLKALARGMQSTTVLDDFFESKHQPDQKSGSSLRFLHYLGKDQQKDAILAGAHSDYGSLTLLFQPDVGGLELLNADSVWVPIKPTKEIVVNIADLLQYWTDSYYISTQHRVRYLGEEHRYSIAFFMHPNDDAPLEVIKCIGEESERRTRERERIKQLSGDEPLKTAGEYLSYRLRITHNH